MKQIKVLHTEWSDGWGGQEIRIINEMLAVREKGVEVYLACKDKAKIKQKALENDIKVYTLPFNGSLDFKTIFALKNIIKKEDIDIVNTHSGKDTWVGGFAAKLSGIKFIRTRHLSNPINPSRLNFINEWTDFIFTTGEGVRDAMIQNNRINPDKIISIPTGIDANTFDKNRYNKKECRNIFKIEDNEIAIGILAVLRSFKRHDVFLNIAKKLKDNFSDKKFKFLIAGDGPKKDSIIEQIKNLNLTDNVVMLGHINNTAEFLMALELFVLTSDKNEGVPQSLMQALFMETPSIATTAGSIKDLHQENNFLISQPNEEDIYNNIKSYLLKEKTIVPNRKLMIDNFSKKASTKKILQVYASLAEREKLTSPRKILVIKFRNIGDVLLTTPLLSSVKKAYPNVKIDVALNKGTEDMITLNPNVNDIIIYDRDKIKSYKGIKRVWEEIKFAYSIRKRDYDIVINTTEGDRGAQLAFISGAKVKIGYKNKKNRLLKNVFDCQMPPQGLRHTIETNLDALRILKLPITDKKVEIFWSKDDEKKVDTLLECKEFIHIHPVSRWLFKCLDDATVARIIDYCKIELKKEVVLTSAPIKQELDKINSILKLCKSDPINLSGKLSLKQTTYLNSRANFFIGVDTAIMHISAANNTPVLAFFGPSGADHWGPWDNELMDSGYKTRRGIRSMGKHTVIQRDWECVPCGKDGCNGTKISDCLIGLDMEVIKKLINDKLGK